MILFFPILIAYYYIITSEILRFYDGEIKIGRKIALISRPLISRTSKMKTKIILAIIFNTNSKTRLRRISPIVGVDFIESRNSLLLLIWITTFLRSSRCRINLH